MHVLHGIMIIIAPQEEFHLALSSGCMWLWEKLFVFTTESCYGDFSCICLQRHRKGSQGHNPLKEKCPSGIYTTKTGGGQSELLPMNSQNRIPWASLWLKVWAATWSTLRVEAP